MSRLLVTALTAAAISGLGTASAQSQIAQPRIDVHLSDFVDEADEGDSADAANAAEEGEEENAQTSTAEFQRGVRALEAGRLAEAEECFRQAYTSNPSDLVQLNWAEALLRLGRVREAAELLESLAYGSADLLVRDAARDLEQRARSQLGSIRIRADYDDAELYVDGRRVEPGRVAVDPGARQVRFERSGREVETRTVQVAAGEATSLTFSQHPLAPLAPMPRRKRRLRIGLSVAAGVLVATVVTALVVGSTRGSGRMDGNLEPIDLGGQAP